MVSKAKARKMAQVQQQIPAKRNLEALCDDDVDDEELLLAIETIQSISRNATLIKSKRTKPLRSAIHDLLRATATSTTGSLTTRISEALSDARWLDARVLLSEFWIRGEEVKLGTLQRWVREVDAAAASGLDVSISAEVFRTLDAILRATASPSRLHVCQSDDRSPAGSTTRASTGHSSDGLLDGSESGVVTFAPTVSFSKPSGIEINEAVRNGSIFAMKPVETYRENAKIVEVTPAAERKPPNQYDATIYTTRGPILTNSPPSNTCRHDIPEVPGAFVIENLLSVEECKAIICQGEAVSFSPDCAIAGSATQQASILAHNFYYFADDHTLGQIYDRASPFLPKNIEECAVTGINARFRVYRYVPGAVYRPHIDGSWPRSGLDLTKPDGQQYIYDDTRSGAQLSRLTFLIYLNDDFAEGYTTFFMPDTVPEKLKGIRVEPRMGSVLVFPHGESVGALLHEGSGVVKGAKYVIRTDVLYEKSHIKK